MPNKDEKRCERLAGLGVKRDMPTPERDAKMSAVILQLAEPLMKQHGTTAERAEALLMLTIAGLNKSMFPPDKQLLIEKDLINAFVPKDSSAEAVGVTVEVLDIIAERRQRLFPDLRKIIVDYEVEIGGGRLTLNVSSTPIPDLGHSATK
jgi:phytoene dehydrogenase-like protein